MEIFTKSAQETQELGQKIGASINRSRGQHARIMALYGELGSGKTTFVQGLAKGLGLPHRIVSPTFIISRQYPLTHNKFQKFYHIDLYRLEHFGQIADIGIDEIFTDPSVVAVIEWAERLGKMLPNKRLDISFEIQDDNRLIKIKEYKFRAKIF